MGALLRSIIFPCRQCGKRATVELFNTGLDATFGKYCTRHGRIAKRELDQLEAEIALDRLPRHDVT